MELLVQVVISFSRLVQNALSLLHILGVENQLLNSHARVEIRFKLT